MLGLVVGEVAAGCGFHSPAGEAVDGGAGGDSGSVGAGSDGGCTFATLVNTCMLPFDADLLVPATVTATFDTDTHTLVIGGTATQVSVKTVLIGADSVDVISAHDVHLGVSAHLRATGSHGLAIIANHDVLVDEDAQIDVSDGGAGARPACPNGADKGQDNNNGAGGGGGGGFGADGGKGGTGNGQRVQGGAQGQAELPFPIGFHGGCPGAQGGTGRILGGDGGKGGGALYVVAADRIVLSSTAPLNAGGGGGQGGPLGGNGGNAGGGGGGSGGLLILEAPHIAAAVATIAANGGAGGQGSDNGGAGGNGDPATVTTARADGGSGGAVTGSDGGAGGSSLGTAGDSVTANADGGGGGGGGSVGFIRIRSEDPVFGALSPLPN